MTGFVASEVVKPLDFDFAPFTSAKGTIKEPTDAQIGQFLEDIKQFYLGISKDQAALEGMAEETDGEKLFEALNQLDLSVLISHIGEMASIYSRLCSGSPSTEQIQALPMRYRSHFFAWIHGEVVNPEAASGAGRAPVVQLSTARTG